MEEGKEAAMTVEKLKRQILKKRRNEFRYYDAMNLRKRRRTHTADLKQNMEKDEQNGGFLEN